MEGRQLAGQTHSAVRDNQLLHWLDWCWLDRLLVPDVLERVRRLSGQTCGRGECFGLLNTVRGGAVRLAANWRGAEMHELRRRRYDALSAVRWAWQLVRSAHYCERRRSVERLQLLHAKRDDPLPGVRRVGVTPIRYFMRWCVLDATASSDQACEQTATAPTKRERKCSA
jgi:hypothetical protein